MKKNLMITTAVLSLFGTVVGAADLGSASYGAGLNLLSPTATGFAYGASVDTTGLGSGAASVTLQAPATFDMTGYASSTSGTVTGSTTDATTANAKSGVVSVVNFDRTVAASGSSIGLGQVVAQGDAKTSVGAVGSAYGLTSNNRIQQITATGEAPSVYGGVSYTTNGSVASTSSAASDSAASLIGTGSTSVVAGLLGKDSNFVGSTGTTVKSNQTGVAYSAMNATGDNAGTGVSIAPINGVVYVPAFVTALGIDASPQVSYATYDEALTAASNFATANPTLNPIGITTVPSLTPNMTTLSNVVAGIGTLGTGQGTAGFNNTFDLGSGATDKINLAVSNVGGGAISLAADTSGFFSGGSATSGATTFGSVFTPTAP